MPGPSELVSIYLPTHRAGKEVTQDPVLFRRLVATAEEEVAEPPTERFRNLMTGSR
jgi:hypothetical protein